MNTGIRTFTQIIPVHDLSRVNSIIPHHHILIECPSEYDVEDIPINSFQSYGTNKVSHMKARVFSCMEFDIQQGEF